jgi:cytochrome c-type biogenesis protein CcmH
VIRRATLALLVSIALASMAAAQPPAAPAPTPGASATSEERVHAVASELRCVVCQNLSVADSPSEMAGQMRGIVRERLAAGETPDQVIQYFVDRYGEWILLSPRRHGFTLLVWVLPFVAVTIGLVVVAVLIWRWRRRASTATDARPAVDPAMSERIKRELESGT